LILFFYLASACQMLPANPIEKARETKDVINLAGIWEFQTDPEKAGEQEKWYQKIRRQNRRHWFPHRTGIFGW
jgi:hypothetical protein